MMHLVPVPASQSVPQPVGVYGLLSAVRYTKITHAYPIFSATTPSRKMREKVGIEPTLVAYSV